MKFTVLTFHKKNDLKFQILVEIAEDYEILN